MKTGIELRQLALKGTQGGGQESTALAAMSTLVSRHLRDS